MRLCLEQEEKPPGISKRIFGAQPAHFPGFMFYGSLMGAGAGGRDGAAPEATSNPGAEQTAGPSSGTAQDGDAAPAAAAASNKEGYSIPLAF